MADLRFTKLPERADVVLGELATGKKVFLKAGSFSSLSDIDQTKYEVLGVVYKRDGNIVKFCHTDNASKTWCERWFFTLSVAAGTTAGKLAVNDSSAWGTFTWYTIPITAFVDSAEGKATLVSELNAYFAANAPFSTQDWFAQVESDGTITLHHNFADYRQASATFNQGSGAINRGADGFTLANNTLADIPALANILRKNGATGGEGVISSLEKAINYFSQDLSSASYNPNSAVTSVKRTYPICLPAYLGTSSYRKDGETQLDYCSALRAVYGEGEAGWRKFMASCLPVVPTDWGNMGLDKAAEYTKLLASKRYSSSSKTDEPLCKAAYYCDSVTKQTLPASSYHLPSTQELYELLDGIKYNVVNNREADELNKTLYKLNATAISCGSNWWSSYRIGTYFAWYAYGYSGTFSNYYMYISYGAVPVSLLKLA